MKKLAILIPCFNEEKVINLFFLKLKKFLYKKKINQKYILNLVFLNNGSTDNTLKQILQIKKNNNKIVSYISLSKNFGYQNNLICGLQNILADYYMIIDCDGEEPIELISFFLDKVKYNHDWIYGIRKKRSENFLLTNLRKIMYRIASISSDHHLKKDVAEFGMINKELRDRVLSISSSFIFLRFFFSYLSVNPVGIIYNRKKRIAGKTNYNFFSFITFAIASYLSTTTFPLRLISYLGLILIILNGYLFFFEFSQKIFLTFNFSFLIISCLSIGVYLARIYKSINKFPNYVINFSKSNFKKK